MDAPTPSRGPPGGVLLLRVRSQAGIGGAVVAALALIALGACGESPAGPDETTFQRSYATTVLALQPSGEGDVRGLLNNAGDVLVWRRSGGGHALVRSRDGTVAELPFTIPWVWREPQFNDLGHVLVDGKVWADGAFLDFGEARATALNDAGDVVLMSSKEQSVSIYRGGELIPVDLSSALPTPWYYLDLKYLSSGGRIGGVDGAQYFQRCFLLDPTTGEASTLLASNCGFVGLDPDGRFSLVTRTSSKPPFEDGWILWDGVDSVAYGGAGRQVAQPGLVVQFRHPTAVARNGLSVGSVTYGEGTGWYASVLGSFAWLVDPPYEYQLDQIIDDRDWVLTDALDVNDGGQILALGIHKATQDKALLLLDPIPPPAAVAAVSLTLPPDRP